MSRPKLMTFPADHEPARWRYVHGCRCEGCTEANRLYHASFSDRLAVRAEAGDEAVPHGTVGGYCNWKCRCAPCKAAGAEHNKRGYASRKARLAADPSIVEHGRMSTYSGWGCRCDECREAARTHAPAPGHGDPAPTVPVDRTDER